MEREKLWIEERVCRKVQEARGSGRDVVPRVWKSVASHPVPQGVLDCLARAPPDRRVHLGTCFPQGQVFSVSVPQCVW